MSNSIVRSSKSTSWHERWKGGWASGFWNFTFFYHSFSKKGRFLGFEKEKWNFTFGPSYKKSFRHPRCIRVHFLHFPTVNSILVLVMSIWHTISCSVLFGIRLFSLFCVMVLLYSVYHLKFKKWRFSTAVGCYKCVNHFPTFVKEDSKYTTKR